MSQCCASDMHLDSAAALRPAAVPTLHSGASACQSFWDGAANESPFLDLQDRSRRVQHV